LHGLITDMGKIAVIAASEKEQDQDIEHNFVAIYSRASGNWLIGDVDFYVTALACAHGSYASYVAIVGMYGEAEVNEPSGVHRETLGTGDDLPNKLRNIHAARCVGKHFYAVGMRRQAFRRAVDRGPWRKIDAGVFVPDSSAEIAGFLSVDGFDDGEVYAVGYYGEIWLYDGKKWRKLNSPTNARLQSVRCLADGTVMACGQAGVVVQGRKDVWKVLNQTITTEPLTAVAGLGTKAYFATEDSLLIEFDGTAFAPVKLPGKRTPTTGFLDANAETLLSIGEEDILTFDGKSWTVITHPPIDPT
jgi:hypothetical protein